MRENKGFTLLELMIAMAIMSMVMAAVFSAFSIFFRIFFDETQRTDIYIEADRGMNRIVSELRETKEIVSASSREVTFWLDDLNGNGTREANETVTYRWSGSIEAALNRIISNETFPVAYGVYNFTLSYDDPNDVKFIDVKLTTGKQLNRATLESSVRPRNL